MFTVTADALSADMIIEYPIRSLLSGKLHNLRLLPEAYCLRSLFRRLITKVNKSRLTYMSVHL